MRHRARQLGASDCDARISTVAIARGRDSDARCVRWIRCVLVRARARALVRAFGGRDVRKLARVSAVEM